MNHFLLLAIAVLLVALVPSGAGAQECPSSPIRFPAAPTATQALEDGAANPSPVSAQIDPSLTRHVVIGAAVGAGAGLAYFAFLLRVLGDWGDNVDRVYGRALYTAGGALAGAAAGFVVWEIRRFGVERHSGDTRGALTLRHSTPHVLRLPAGDASGAWNVSGNQRSRAPFGRECLRGAPPSSISAGRALGIASRPFGRGRAGVPRSRCRTRMQ